MSNPQEPEKPWHELHNQKVEPMVAAEVWLISLSLISGIILLLIMALVLKN